MRSLFLLAITVSMTTGAATPITIRTARSPPTDVHHQQSASIAPGTKQASLLFPSRGALLSSLRVAHF
jgi:hypothetical protein